LKERVSGGDDAEEIAIETGVIGFRKKLARCPLSLAPTRVALP